MGEKSTFGSLPRSTRSVPKSTFVNRLDDLYGEAFYRRVIHQGRDDICCRNIVSISLRVIK